MNLIFQLLLSVLDFGLLGFLGFVLFVCCTSLRFTVWALFVVTIDLFWCWDSLFSFAGVVIWCLWFAPLDAFTCWFCLMFGFGCLVASSCFGFDCGFNYFGLRYCGFGFLGFLTFWVF